MNNDNIENIANTEENTKWRDIESWEVKGQLEDTSHNTLLTLIWLSPFKPWEIIEKLEFRRNIINNNLPINWAADDYNQDIVA